ncbi:hypothetical protein [Psychrosphaera haliotis]|uniref:Lipoprotein n=1 Tax=Psychrosphaera haliotis TaxID=555083 RepID=A0A6N8FAN1_9GAMM|nr:hypothetical protein [Psychrosphaera haliotis]MUH72030.1 hypothetical protein [Psychrosphaera haliotis]
MKIFKTALLSFFLIGCSSINQNSVTETKPPLSQSKIEQRAMMIGMWYGDLPTKEGGRKQWTVVRSPDGTYKVDFLITSVDSSQQRFSETGVWGVSGNIYFSIYLGAIDQGQFYPSNRSDPSIYDAYKIITLTSSTFEYQSIDTSNRYILNKVPPSFILGQSEL